MEKAGQVESLIRDYFAKLPPEERQTILESLGESLETGNQQEVLPLEEAEGEEAYLPDITEVDIKKQFFVPKASDEEGYLRMKAFTPARLGLWRAGPRYKTQSMLRFRADHAAAQDAVFSDVSTKLIEALDLIPIQTKCQDKDEYVTRPDLGREFSEEVQAEIKERIKGQQPVQIVVGDGLSSAAIEANLATILPAIKQGLKLFDLAYTETLFIKYSRVGAMDPIGELTEAECVCMLIGERPGLVTAESMSAYIAYRPTSGMPEARRTVISNIQKGGTPAVEAGAYIAEVIATIVAKKKSGVALKEEQEVSNDVE